MRRTALIGTWIAAVALTAPAVVPQEVPSPPLVRSTQSPSADGLAALRDVSLARPAAPHLKGATPAAERPRGLGLTGVPPAAAPVPAATPAAPRPYTVRPGDSLWSIATAHGLTVEALAAANGLSLTAGLQPGQRLTVAGGARAAAPATRRPGAADGIVHVVRSGETLWAISQRYGVRLEDVMAANDLGDDGWIRPGQRIRIAGPAALRYREVAAQSRSATTQVVAEMRRLQATGGFLWPARGVITSRFGWRYRRHHNGIDIAAPRGTPIYAARDGVVEFAGWKGGYGRVVYLEHGGGIQTVYGHASALLVQAGERVAKGDLIARVGCTGVCTGPHLHFEVRVNGRAVNPLGYLR